MNQKNHHIRGVIIFNFEKNFKNMVLYDEIRRFDGMALDQGFHTLSQNLYRSLIILTVSVYKIIKSREGMKHDDKTVSVR